MNSPEALKAWMSAEKDYWNQQPQAVKALQHMQPAQRAAQAESLQAEGYNIDVPIMEWGWDPVQTNFLRRADGLSYDANLLQEAEV